MDEIDADLFEAAIARARGGDVASLATVLEWWRGTPLSEAHEAAWADAERARLEELRREAVELLRKHALAGGVPPLLQGDAQLGIEPSPHLRRLDQQMLQKHPSLDGIAGAPPALPSGVVTFLLTDVARSTQLWERNPRAMDAALARHEDLITAAVGGNRGTLLKTKGEGDSTFSVFARASDAVAAAVAIDVALTAEPWPTDTPIAVRAAVHTGEAIERNGDYYGPAVNRVARLRAIAAPGQILLSQVTADLVTDHVPLGATLERVGNHHLKDLTRPETVYRLVVGQASDPGAVPIADPLATLAVEWEIPLPAPLLRRARDVFVGRDDELEVIRAAAKRAAHGERQVVLISGDAGLGKSSLVARAAEEIGGDIAVAYGRCVEDVGVPYEPFSGVVQQLTASMPAPALEAWTTAFGGPVARAFPSGRSGGVRTSAEAFGGDVLEADVERHLLYRAVRELVTTAAAARPLVVVLEDLHWIDRSSVLLLRYMLDIDGPVAIVATYRDREIHDGHPLADLLAHLRRIDGVSRVALGGLGDSETVELVEQLAGHVLAPDEAPFIHGLRRETEGNPFFLREILLHLLETGTVGVGTDGRWRLTDAPERTALPASVVDVVTSRVARLGPDVVEVLRAVAVIGRSFDLGVAVRVAGRSEDEVLDVLDRADDAGLVTATTGGSFQFSHSLVQQTLYQSQSATRLARVHRRVAEALEEKPESADRVRELAYHWSSAIVPADAAKAVHYAARAGALALAELAPHDAIRWFSHALELPRGGESDRCQLLVGLGEAQQQAGLPEHRETLLEAGRIAAAIGSTDLAIHAALVNNRGGPSSRFDVDADRVAALDDALEMAAGRPADCARLLATKAAELVSQADPGPRRMLAEQALAAAREAADDATTLLVQHLRFDAVWAPDTLAVRGDIAAEMAIIAGRLGDPLSAFRSALRQAAVCIETGDGPGFDSAVDEVVRLADQTGFPYMRWSAEMSRSCQATMQGRFDDAEHHAEASLQIGTDSGQPEAFGVYGILLAEIRRHQGRLPELLPVLEDAMATMPFPALECLIAIALLEVGRADDALTIVRRHARERFASVHYDEIWVSALILAAEVAIDAEDAEVAAVIVDLLRPYEEQVGFTRATMLGATSRYVGRLGALAGDQRAMRCLDLAAATHAGLGATLWCAYSDLDRAWLLAREGRAQDARPLVDRAVEQAQRLGAARITRLAAALC